MFFDSLRISIKTKQLHRTHTPELKLELLNYFPFFLCRYMGQKKKKGVQAYWSEYFVTLMKIKK